MTQPPAYASDAPPVRSEPDARQRIRTALTDSGRRIAVLDDDPTGSQTVHDVAVVTVFDPEEIAAGLDGPASTCFILTNTRSMSEADAVALNTRVGRTLFELSRRLEAPVDVISRSDSTLRGHVIAEVTALDAARREVLGRGYDGVLLIPAYLEAGRFTAGEVPRPGRPVARPPGGGGPRKVLPVPAGPAFPAPPGRAGPAPAAAGVGH